MIVFQLEKEKKKSIDNYYKIIYTYSNFLYLITYNMKKILILLTLILWLFSSYSFAWWGCYQDPIVEVNYIAKITTAANVRDRPCMSGTKVVSVAPLGEMVQVIADNDGWIKIKRSNGVEWRVWTWLTSKTNQTPPKAPVNTDNLYNTTTVKKNIYYPSKADKIFLERIYGKIENIANKYPEKLANMLDAISKLKKKYINKARLYYILNQIENYLEKKVDMLEIENMFEI